MAPASVVRIVLRRTPWKLRASGGLELAGGVEVGVAIGRVGRAKLPRPPAGVSLRFVLGAALGDAQAADERRHAGARPAARPRCSSWFSSSQQLPPRRLPRSERRPLTRTHASFHRLPLHVTGRRPRSWKTPSSPAGTPRRSPKPNRGAARTAPTRAPEQRRQRSAALQPFFEKVLATDHCGPWSQSPRSSTADSGTRTARPIQSLARTGRSVRCRRD